METDKITLEIHAEADGILSLKAKEGETLKVGTVIAVLQESAGNQKSEAETKSETVASKSATEPKQTAHAKEPPKAKEEKPVPSPVKSTEAPAAKSPSPTAPERSKVDVPPTAPPAAAKIEAAAASDERISRKPMSAIRRKIAERLLVARQQTAMVTTFNEADMSRIVDRITSYNVCYTKLLRDGLVKRLRESKRPSRR